MDPRNLVLLIVALLNFVLAVFIYQRGRLKITHVTFCLTVLCVALWSLGLAFFRITPSLPWAKFWSQIYYIAAALIASNFCYFSLVFPCQITTLTLFRKILIYLFPAVSTLLFPISDFLIQSVVEHPWGKEVVLSRSDHVLYSIWFVFIMGWAFVHLYQKYRLSEGTQRMQIRYILSGTLISTLFGAAFNLILPLFGNYRLIWLGPPFTIIMISFITYAITKYRLLDIKIVAVRTIVYSVLLLTTLTFYATLVLLSQRFFQDTVGFTLSVIIGALLTALGFEPLRRFFQKVTERVFFKNQRHPQEFLSDLTENLSSITDLQKMLISVTDLMTDFFNLQRMAIALENEEADRYTASVYKGFWIEPHASFSLDREHLFIRHFSQPQTAPLIYDELDMIQPAPDSRLRGEMENLGLAVIVPVSWKAHLLGLLLLGPKQSGDPYTPEDLKLLDIVARQAATSIENSLLYNKVQQQMNELRIVQTQQLIQSAKLASLGELATNVAHEINNPLTSILGFTTLILEDMGDHDPRKQDLKIIQSEAMRSRDIVRNLLDFARKRGIKKEATDINPLIQKTLNLLRHQAEISNIRLNEDYAPDLPTIIVDADQMKQVFINLLKNAFDAMPKGGTLTITTRAHGLNGPRTEAGFHEKPLVFADRVIEIRFKDTGEGIAKEHLPKIFDPFFTTKEGLGTGLGLAVSYGIIERHSGRIEVESVIGEGTTFVIKLPVKQEAPMSQETG
ncbi:MAG: GAF domain-containing protein [Nitrospirae bacterium]|nr:GAF domain-containing protein [Nitrospirota bacterium]